MPSPITFQCPLPHEDLRFESMTATQALSTLESIELLLVADKPDIAAEKLLGHAAGVTLRLRGGAQREFNGLVTRFGLGRSQGRYYQYQATLRPWLWFLTRTADCRIFQDLTVKQIVEKVFADHAGIAHFEFKLFRSYRQRVYCVQYRETDFNFVARLLEEEGIFWFFDHAAGVGKLVLTDDTGGLTAAEGAEKLPYFDNAGQAPPDTDHVTGWTCSREVRTGKMALTSYDFERPSTSLAVDHAMPRSHPLADLEQFDFDGQTTQKADGQHLADCRIEDEQARFERQAGSTNAHALTVGHLFSLTRHPRGDQNAEHLCLQTSISVQLPAHEAGDGGEDFQCHFAAMPSKQAFRPERRTPKPFVQGPQTAVVVGPAGEEIYTDKYGRVKVQFHWDRYGKKNESSSCWMRVSSPWAGKSFGFVQLPRIGQEVVVDFLEGDPDQPIITGRVYNAEQMPPWELPANATQSGVLTRSSKGGTYGNANALRFEDKKGAEQLWLHAEKNQDIEVENDETHWVGQWRLVRACPSSDTIGRVILASLAGGVTPRRCQERRSMDMLIKLFEPPARAAAAPSHLVRKPIGPEQALVLRWVAATFSAGWASEAQVALANRPVSLFIATRAESLAGFCCYDATARGLVGPIGVAPPARGGGIGAALLLACLSDMRGVGYGYAIVGGVGAPEFFQRVAGAIEIQGSTPGLYAGMLRP